MVTRAGSTSRKDEKRQDGEEAEAIVCEEDPELTFDHMDLRMHAYVGVHIRTRIGIAL